MVRRPPLCQEAGPLNNRVACGSCPLGQGAPLKLTRVAMALVPAAILKMLPGSKRRAVDIALGIEDNACGRACIGTSLR